MPLNRPANQDWDEIATGGPAGKGPAMTMDGVLKTVPTAPKHATRPRHISIENLSSQDLNVLKKKDSFGFYSIPQVRSAHIFGRQINSSALEMFQLSQPSVGPSKPKKVRGESPSNKPKAVMRRSRISFEVHPDLYNEDLLADMLEDDGDQGPAAEDCEAEAAEEVPDPLDEFMAKFCPQKKK